MAYPTLATLPGAQRLMRGFSTFAKEDMGGKIQSLISMVTALQSNVATLQAAAVSANVSGATFSALSGVTFTAYSAISNFSAT